MAVLERLKVPAYVWRQTGQALLEDDFVAELETIVAPTLIVWGARDSLCPHADQAALLSKIADARLTVYESAGHALHWEEPHRFATDLLAFVQTVQTSG